MNKTYKIWSVWIIFTAVVVTFGFLRGWTMFHKILLVAVVVLGVLQLVGPVLRGRMLRRLKGMLPEEREKFLARFDQKTQALLRKQLESYDV
jgi:hypothetical protein